MSRPIDGATAEVIRSYLLSAAQEMKATLVRTAFNPVIYEVLDFGISMYDRKLDLVAEAPGLTMFLGANDFSVRKVVEYLGVEAFEDGDVVISNYPYWNAAHTYDASLIAAVFVSGFDGPFGFLCVRAHWADLGAKDPGYVLDSTDMHQEGLVFPGTKVFKRGEPDREIIELIRFNSRMPEIVVGDLNAMVASLRTGERRLRETVAKFGRETVDAAIAVILDHGERTTARALAELPHGSWSAEDIIDDDGISDDPITMKATVTIGDGAFTVDFTGSAGTQKGPVNMPFGTTLAMCKVVFKALTTPETPSNAGHTRALEVIAEPGNLFHAVYPAPTFTLWTGIVGLELLFKALAQAMPERFSASSGGDVPGFMMLGVHPDTGKFFALSNNDPVGWGASPRHDGASALLHLSESIVRNTPLEVLETNTTMFFERFELRQRFGRAGQVSGRARAAARHPLPLRRRVPDRDEEDQEPPLGACRRHGTGCQHGHRVPGHGEGAAHEHPAGSGQGWGSRHRPHGRRRRTWGSAGTRSFAHSRGSTRRFRVSGSRPARLRQELTLPDLSSRRERQLCASAREAVEYPVWSLGMERRVSCEVGFNLQVDCSVLSQEPRTLTQRDCRPLGGPRDGGPGDRTRPAGFRRRIRDPRQQQPLARRRAVAACRPLGHP